MFIKALNKNLTSIYGNFQYEIRKEYWINKNVKLEMCFNGFHFCDNLNDTLNYYNINITRYFEVEPLGKIIKDNSKYCSEGIKILREIPVNELINLDNISRWCYEFAKCVKDSNIQQLQQKVIEKDSIGYWCYRFAKDIKNADIQLLQQKVIEKDIDGHYCYWFAKNIENANIPLLYQTIIAKDKTGEWCLEFTKNIINN